MHREPQGEAEVVNAALLEQHGLGPVTDPGNLDQWDFQRNAHGPLVDNAGQKGRSQIGLTPLGRPSSQAKMDRPRYRYVNGTGYPLRSAGPAASSACASSPKRIMNAARPRRVLVNYSS